MANGKLIIELIYSQKYRKKYDYAWKIKPLYNNLDNTRILYVNLLKFIIYMYLQI